MEKISLYINGEKVQLSDKATIALSYQFNNIGELNNQQGNTSNRLTVSLTEGSNNRILGYPSTIPLINYIPYQELTAKIVQDGLEVVRFGKAEIIECSEREATIIVTSGNTDFFDKLQDKIKVLVTQFEKYNHTWNLANAVSSQTKTSGWIYPIIDYGAGLSGAINVSNLRPGFFLRTLVEEIASATGYTLTGKILEDPFYQRIVLPLSKVPFLHGDGYAAYIDEFKASCVRPGYNYQIVPQSALSTTVPMVSSLDKSGSWNGSEYVSKETFDVIVQLDYSIYVEQVYFGSGNIPAFKVQIMKNGVSVAENFHESDPLIGNKNYPLQTLLAEISVVPGDKIRVECVQFPVINRAFAHFTLHGCVFDPVQEYVTFGQQVQCEMIVPDVAQKDLLKAVFQKFGIICITDNLNKTVELVQFKEVVLNKGIADDWSDIMIDTPGSISYKLGDFAQVNELKYREDETVTRGYGDGSLTSNNKNLKTVGTAIESIFSASEASVYNNAASVPVKAIGIDMTKAEYRILVDQKVAADIQLTDGVTTVVLSSASIPYFTGANDGLMWDQLKASHLMELQDVLNDTVKINKRFMLTAAHIESLNFKVPVYLRQYGAYFYKNVISNYVAGQPTEVELVKI